ncbi:TPA: hypothetical protein N0F65_002160 [Lagenidium giganteum]|uniref:Uncharacterized protein n=1 Tax=Lagenidium giganteum TaxID=4803 RepID=A0AAV2YNK5_9STRA|nr:TPA: hypothetical protein N0F65_002160 [Lagenidium giganteum]
MRLASHRAVGLSGTEPPAIGSTRRSRANHGVHATSAVDAV